MIKYQKGPFLGHFGPFSPFFGRTRFFLENWARSLYSTHGPLTSCQKLEKSLERLLRSCVTDGRTDGQTDVYEFIASSDPKIEVKIEKN